MIYFQEHLKLLNVINNRTFTKNIFKNNSKRKRNLIIYHFLEESKPYERIDLLITASVNTYQKKKEKKYSNSNENMLLKLMKQFGKPPFLREPPSFN